MQKSKKEFIGATVFLFIVICGFMNWNSISWIFSYREMSGLANAFFNPYQDSKFLVSASDIQLPVQKPVDLPSAAPKPVYPYSDKANSIEIPKIAISAPLVVAASSNQAALTKELDKGAVYYPGSVYPGDNGQIIVLGHSAPPNWPKIKHDWIFSDINSLNIGDQIILYFDNRQYTYLVTTKNIIKKGQELTFDGSDNNILTIVSCWPPGKDYQRIAIDAELIKI